jgi:hypothetical protein
VLLPVVTGKGNSLSGKHDTNLTRITQAQAEMGTNRLQGDDQGNVRNQRRAVPDIETETDGVFGSFEKLDKDARHRPLAFPRHSAQTRGRPVQYRRPHALLREQAGKR